MSIGKIVNYSEVANTLEGTILEEGTLVVHKGNQAGTWGLYLHDGITSGGNSVIADTNTGLVAFNDNEIIGSELSERGSSLLIFTDYTGNTPPINGNAIYLDLNNSTYAAITTGWTVTFADGTTNIVDWANVPAEYINVALQNSIDKTGAEIWPVTITSPDYRQAQNSSLILRPNSNDADYGVQLFNSIDNDTHMRPLKREKGISLGFAYGAGSHIRVEGSTGQWGQPSSGDKVGILASDGDGTYAEWTFDKSGNLNLPNGGVIAQSYDSEIATAENNYNDQVNLWANWMTSEEFTSQPNPGWTFTSWQVNGTNVDQYIVELTAAWQIQTTPSSPPSPLVFEPAISMALYTQLRTVLLAIKGTYEIWQSLLTSVDIATAGATLSVLGNGKVVTPEIIQTSPDEDLTIRTRYTLASSPPGSTPSYQNLDFKFGTNGTLTFPNGTTQYGAAIDLVYLKSIVASSTDFNDFKNRIASL